jgi:hypothetical protein
MGLRTERFRHALPTAAAILAGVQRQDGNYSLTSACRLVFEDGPEPRPARIVGVILTR